MKPHLAKHTVGDFPAFGPQQLDQLQHAFERAWSAYLIDFPVLDHEWRSLREQLASTVLESAGLVLRGGMEGEDAMHSVKRLALKRFIAQRRFSSH